MLILYIFSMLHGVFRGYCGEVEGTMSDGMPKIDRVHGDCLLCSKVSRE